MQATGRPAWAALSTAGLRSLNLPEHICTVVAVRQLYTDHEEVTFTATRPIILNGIEDIVTRSDLADRGLLLQLQPIQEASRRTEGELRQAFRQDRQNIPGALLDSMVQGDRHRPQQGVRVARV